MTMSKQRKGCIERDLDDTKSKNKNTPTTPQNPTKPPDTKPPDTKPPDPKPPDPKPPDPKPPDPKSPETSEKSPLNPNNSDISSNTHTHTQSLTTQHLDIVQKATDELVAAAKLNNIKLNTNDTPQNDTQNTNDTPQNNTPQNDTPQNNTPKTDIENQSINT